MRMTRLLIGLALVVAFASAAVAQPPNLDLLVRQVASEHPDLLQTNTNATCFRFVQYVLERANDARWGHVGKTRGEGQYTPPGFAPRVVKGRDGNDYMITGVSHDALFFKDGDSEWQVDILGAGNDGPDPLGQPARPQWAVIPQQFYRVNNPWLKAIPVAGSTSPPPVVCPVCPTCPICKPTPGYAGDQVFDQVGAVLFADYAEAGQAPNEGMARWMARTIYDWIAGVTKTLQASIDKHRKEWRAALGLP